MIIVVAETGGYVNAELMSSLGGYAQIPAILEGVAASAGGRFDQLGDGRIHPVVGYVLRPEEVFTAYVATPNVLSVFELERGGSSLIVTFPWSRIGRIVQSTANGQLALSFELDADRMDIAGTVRQVDGTSEMSGVIRRSGYVLTAPLGSEDAAGLMRFGALARRHLRS